MLKWIFERCEGTAKAIETPIGNLPAPDAIDTSGLSDVTPEDLAELMRVDVDGLAPRAAADLAVLRSVRKAACRAPCATSCALLEEGLEGFRR